MNSGGFDFEIAVAPSAGVRFLRHATIALGAVGLALSAWLTRHHENGWLLLGLGLIMLWAGWRHGRLGLAWGRLSVDGRGGASWHEAPPSTGRARDVVAGSGGSGVGVQVERWFAGERLAWLRLRDPGGRRYEILLGRGSIDEDRWRRLSAWLAWVRRGTSA